MDFFCTMPAILGVTFFGGVGFSIGAGAGVGSVAYMSFSMGRYIQSVFLKNSFRFFTNSSDEETLLFMSLFNRPESAPSTKER